MLQVSDRIDLVLPSFTVKDSKCWSDGALEQCPFRPDPRQYAHTHEHAKEMMGEIMCRYGRRDRAVRLTCLDAFKEKPLNAAKYRGDDLLELRIVGRNFQSRVHEQTALVIAIGQ